MKFCIFIWHYTRLANNHANKTKNTGPIKALAQLPEVVLGQIQRDQNTQIWKLKGDRPNRQRNVINPI